MQTIRAVAIDIWRAGMPTLDPIVARGSPGLELHFVHCESLTFPFLPKHRRMSGLKAYESRADRDRHYASIRDISSYGYSLADAVAELRPDLAIFVSLHGFFHRWGNLVCNTAGVPCMHIMHGNRASWGVDAETHRWMSPLHAAKRFLYYTALFSLYVRDCTRYSLGLDVSEAVKEYVEVIFRHANYVRRPGRRRNINYETLCVIDSSDEPYFKSRYGIRQSTRVVPVGPVELSDLRLPFLRLRRETLSDRHILFISQPVASSGVMDSGKYVCIVKHLSRVASNIGSGLLVRAHPRDDADVIDELQAEQVSVSTDRPLAYDFARAGLVVGLYSTALVTAHHLGLPVVALKSDDAPPMRYLKGRNRVTWLWIKDVVENCSLVHETLERAFELGLSQPPDDERNDPANMVLNEIQHLVAASR